MPQPPPRTTLFPYTTLFRSLRTTASGLTSLFSSSASSHLGSGSSFPLLEVHQAPSQLWSPSSANTASDRDCGFRSEEHTSELQSQSNLVCCLLLERKKHIQV